MVELFDTLDQLGAPKILVFGDLMLDRYLWGDAERVSPEAPVLVLRTDLEEVRLGGAASVALLLRGLGAEVRLAGVVGNDFAGQTLLKLLAEENIGRALILHDEERPTTTKERFVGRAANRHPHQILRVDRESRAPLNPHLEQQLFQAIERELETCLVLLVSDYGKGVCTPWLLQQVITAARARQIPILVDPARGIDYIRYRQATLIKPNRSEAQEATGLQIDTPDQALAAGRLLCERLELQAALITLDRDGMALVPAEEPGELVPTRQREIYDITGAGDMALAALGLCHAARLSWSEAARVANLAAGLEIERLGVTPISRDELKRALQPARPATGSKVVSLEEMIALADAYRHAGKSVVFTNGCFDLLHVGHLTYLEEATALGDVLVVAINSDQSVRRLKGHERPVIPEHDRARLLAGLACVRHVLVFDADTPHDLLRRIRPDVLVKGGTYTPDQVVGREIVQEYGGHVCVAGQVPGISTSRIVSTLRDGVHMCRIK